MTILSSDIFGYCRICSDILGTSSNRLYIGGSKGFLAEILNSEFRGRRSAW